eukprot:TRINITY_DN2220_c0_g1_i1.p1 TRINITY_DN2220_c0_g1~~TRINITY_DN2220_c0_g1_i1.p1  ORF type:complete len:333 (+),score=61.61 TRINITY_DN2220_c0_g1_i1:159-1157(+)
MDAIQVTRAFAVASSSANVLPSSKAASAAALRAPAQPASVNSGSLFAATGSALAFGGLAVQGGRKRKSIKARTARCIFGSAQPSPQKPLAVPGLVPKYRDACRDPLLAEADAGFDPLNLAVSPSPFWGKDVSTNYFNYREAEIKHGRLAMLATLGWFTSEELQASLARKLGLPDDLAPGELAPTLVNGGLNKLPIWFLPAVFLLTAYIENLPNMQGRRVNGLTYKTDVDSVPGDLGFDPLNLSSGLKAQMGIEFAYLHNAEIKHGRAAMIAILAFVVQEYITKQPLAAEMSTFQLAKDTNRVIGAVDRAIDYVDQVEKLSIPDVPVPFPGLQ